MRGEGESLYIVIYIYMHLLLESYNARSHSYVRGLMPVYCLARQSLIKAISLDDDGPSLIRIETTAPCCS